MLIERAEVEGRVADVRLEQGRVAAVEARLERRRDEETLDAAGGALLPGLHDHHVHLLALAAALGSARCGPPHVRDRDGLARALRAAPPRGGWVRGVGYHDSVAGALDRDTLDHLRPDVPVRVQHRSGALWLVNSAGVARLGLDAGADAPGVERDAAGRATGRLFRLDAWLRERLGASPPDLAEVGRRLARVGVTGVTDATPANAAAELEIFAAARRSRALPQRLLLMGRTELPEPDAPGVERGHRKLLLVDADLPPPEEIASRIRAAHDDGRGVAVHCVTRAELVVALAAFAEVGVRPGDRIEHASVTPPDAVELLAALGLTVVTQPNFVAERGDRYAVEVEACDRPWLYRCRGLLDAGVPLGGGTDAPFGEPDPWRAMRAAVERRSAGGRLLGAGEALAPERALALFTTPAAAPGGTPRRVLPGARADLCLLHVPWRTARAELSSRLVRATFGDGRRL